MISSYSPTHWRSIRFISPMSLAWNIFMNTTCTPKPENPVPHTEIEFLGFMVLPVASHGHGQDRCCQRPGRPPTNLSSPGVLDSPQLLLQIHCGFSDIVIPLSASLARTPHSLGAPTTPKVFEPSRLPSPRHPSWRISTLTILLVLRLMASDYVIAVIIYPISPNDGDTT